MSDVLHEVLGAVDRAVAEGVLPVVVLDVDSTLFSTAERHRRILVEFAQDLDQDEVLRVALAARADDFRWSADEPLRAAGIDDPAILDALHAFWEARFFSDAFCHLDLPVPGARDFVQALADRGGLCVYLTARVAEGMSIGTVTLLRRWRFPLHDGRTMLVLKQPGLGDGAYKALAAERVGRLGRVVAAFDNEPKHVNAFAAAFPGAVCVLVGTACSPDAPAPVPTARRLAGFT